MEVFIPGNIPSSKNSKIATAKGVFHSTAVGKFLREIGVQHYSASRKEFKLYKTKPCHFPVDSLRALFKDVQYPCLIGFHFVRNSKRKADFHNLVQIVLDMMTAADIIPDDDMSHIFPVPYLKEGKYFTVDKNIPGVFIKILQ